MSRLIDLVIVAYFLAYAEKSSASETNLEKANSKLPTKYYYILWRRRPGVGPIDMDRRSLPLGVVPK